MVDRTGVNEAELARRHGATSLRERGVEAPRVPDLDRNTAGVGLLQDPHALTDVLGYRLFAERRQAGSQRGQDQLRMRIGGRSDHHSVQTSTEEPFHRLHRLCAEPLNNRGDQDGRLVVDHE